MIMDNSLHAIKAVKAKWEKEIDYYLIMAVTTDFKLYPLEIQEIIIAEFKKREFHKVA